MEILNGLARVYAAVKIQAQESTVALAAIACVILTRLFAETKNIGDHFRGLIVSKHRVRHIVGFADSCVRGFQK